MRLDDGNPIIHQKHPKAPTMNDPERQASYLLQSLTNLRPARPSKGSLGKVSDASGQKPKTPGSLQINLLFTMYAEQAHCHLADANFYFFKDKDFFRSRAEGAPLGRQTIGDALCACEASLRPLSSQHQNLGGAERDRTADPLLAKQVLSQLSYSPIQVSIPDRKPPNRSRAPRPARDGPSGA